MIKLKLIKSIAPKVDVSSKKQTKKAKGNTFKEVLQQVTNKKTTNSVKVHKAQVSPAKGKRKVHKNTKTGKKTTKEKHKQLSLRISKITLTDKVIPINPAQAPKVSLEQGKVTIKNSVKAHIKPTAVIVLKDKKNDTVERKTEKPSENFIAKTKKAKLETKTKANVSKKAKVQKDAPHQVTFKDEQKETTVTTNGNTKTQKTKAINSEKVHITKSLKVSSESRPLRTQKDKKLAKEHNLHIDAPVHKEPDNLKESAELHEGKHSNISEKQKTTGKAKETANIKQINKETSKNMQIKLNQDETQKNNPKQSYVEVHTNKHQAQPNIQQNQEVNSSKIEAIETQVQESYIRTQKSKEGDKSVAQKHTAKTPKPNFKIIKENEETYPNNITLKQSSQKVEPTIGNKKPIADVSTMQKDKILIMDKNDEDKPTLHTVDNKTTQATPQINQTYQQHSQPPIHQVTLQPPMDKIIEHINKLINLKLPITKSVTLQLNPPTLGNLQIKVSIDIQKNLNATITVHNKDTYKTIVNHIDSLKEYLANNGIRVQNIDIHNSFNENFLNQFSTSAGNYGQQGQTNSQQAEPFSNLFERNIDAPKEKINTRTRHVSGIDLTV